MRQLSETTENGVRNLSAYEFNIDSVEIRLLRLPLNEPFETSFHRMDTRLIFLVGIEAEGLTGWGEVVAAEAPLYSYETVQTAAHAIREFLAPVALNAPIGGLDDIARRFAPFRGHNMAKAGIELALMDLIAKLRGQSLSQLINGSRQSVNVGVSLGIQSSLQALLDRVDKYLSLGYQRIKLKIKPGWDIDIVSAVRERHPDILLSVDANCAYRLSDLDHLRLLDQFGLLMIEQPLDHDDLLDHARLQSELETSLCLDESVTSVNRAAAALELGSCRLINVKIGRVGGYSQALAIHDLCHSKDVPVWCGGMLESGIGRAHNIALASLPGFSLPGDISASSRYFARDVIVPEVKVSEQGTVQVPGTNGIGFEVDWEYLETRTDSVEKFVPKA
jgi:O-succinylbenzoate synthase